MASHIVGMAASVRESSRRQRMAKRRGGGVDERWALGFLNDVILTRDPWMHRVDITRAAGVPMTLTAEHDGVLIADVVAEWAQRHGAAYDLELTGAAGGTWSRGG